ncbi:hypothetical protein FA95DRAFT_1613588 [Auriscalpium vulgare]|uniref:Uncharacterized protein n=1 Tax=Auriscalpium vulgare TaxID=40419 RepID=A0ACB8R2B1_9AGAM|nr:hypothetical protein FA95DRAFT_1613588 [Auriscalpium vulgare]
MPDEGSVDGGESDTARAHDAGQHNAGLPVSRIPPEILTAAFSILASIDSPCRYSKSLAWIAITHVCRRWRHITLNNPALWSTIILPFPLGARWAEAFFSRSQNADLTITKLIARYSPPIRQSELALVHVNLSRTRSLGICTDIKAGNSALSAPAPLLHTLDIDFRDSPPSLPDGLLSAPSGTPALQHLRVTTRGALPWTSPLLAHLVTLDIVFGKQPMYSTAGLVEVLDALQAMRNTLERLVVALKFTDVDGAAHSVIQMGKLRQMDLKGSAETASLLFSNIALPVDASIRCTIGPIADGRDIETSLPKIAACLGTLSNVKIALNNYDSCEFQHTFEVATWRDGNTESAPALAAAFVLDEDGSNEVEIIAGATAAAFSEHVKHLIVQSNIVHWPWEDALQHAHSLHDLVVEGLAALPFLSTLFDSNENFLPSLSTLAIHRFNFLMEGMGADRRYYWYSTELVRCLGNRARAGCALKVLDITGSGMDKKTVSELRQMPGMEVRWSEHFDRSRLR